MGRWIGTGLLGRCDALASQRPSVAPSAWSFVGWLRGSDHADGAPAACYWAGTQWKRRFTRGVPGSAIVRSALRRREVIPAQQRAPHVPPGRRFFEVGSCCGFGCGPRPRIVPLLWCGRLARRMGPWIGTGLLVRCDALASQRPSVAPSAWSLVGRLKGSDHADGAPAACYW